MEDYDGQLSAAIIRNIKDVEAAITHAEDVVDERLSKEWNEAFERVQKKGEWYYSDETSWDGWFCPLRWTSEGGRKRSSKAWFDIVTLGDDYYSWVANFIAGPPYAALQFAASPSKTKLLPIYAKKQSVVDALRGLGWHQEGTSFRFLLQIDADALASGFEDDDLSVAAEAFENAASVLDQSLSFFDELQLEVERVG